MGLFGDAIESCFKYLQFLFSRKAAKTEGRKENKIG